MQLKKIELQGFKSFADKTEIVFLDGITTIVGPNGSGKSNISDAVRWVLGEQSVKTLRGSKMEDVIFAGTQIRKKVGFAEVSMYLDNSDSTLPVEYSEVVVTRRVYRNGESNYLINGNECRLKDIQELFMDTGVGRDGYSIISQGKIDEILSSKSEERRHIFEEASGIVKYRVRKEEATRKLANTDINLNRVLDILTEIESNIGPLAEKCEKAKEFLSLRDRLKTFDMYLFINEIEKNKKEIEKLDDIVETLSQDIEKEEECTTEFEKNKLELKARFAEITEKIESTNNQYFELESTIQKLNSSIEISNSKIASSNENIERLNNEIKEDNEKIESLNEEIKSRLEKREYMTKNKKKFEDELAEKQNDLNELMKTLDSKASSIEDIKVSIDASQEEKYELKANISSMEATIDASLLQIDEKKRVLDKNISQKDKLTIESQEIISLLNNKEKEYNTLTENYNLQKVNLDKKNNELNLFVEKKNNLNQEIMTLKSKYNYLTNLEKENEGYFKSVKLALDFAKDNQMENQVFGTVASLVSTDEKYEYAIEIALGGYLQNIVVDTDESATKVVDYLKTNSLGRATFLPINSLKSVNYDTKLKFSKYNGFIGTAIELVKFDKKYSKAIELALANTIIVENVNNAIQISKKNKNAVRIVTLDGELIASTGSITGGKQKVKSTGLIGRQDKLEKLKRNIENKEKDLEKIVKDYQQINLEVQNINQELEKVKFGIDSLNIDIATYKEKSENVKKELQRAENYKNTNNEEILKLTEQVDKLKKEIETSNNKIIEIDEQVKENQHEIDVYVLENEEKGKELEDLNEDILNLKISLSSFDESVASIDEMKEKIEQDIENFNNSIIRKNEQLDNLNKNIEELKLNIENSNNEINSKLEFKQEYILVTSKLKESKLDISKKQDELEIKVLESVKKIEKIKEEKSKTENKKIKYDLETENLKNKMWDEYEVTITSAKSFIESMPVIDIKEININKEAEKIRKQIKELGDVDVSSIEEYSSTKQRYDFILAQKTDLEETKNKLQNLINNMTSIMKSQFAKQFATIKENFNTTFKELFGGGKAELVLSDESNILESGIEIEVQPPGKKLQSMMLLSGGERALTATALLFAILKIKSPPFCILDEIEAALDDVNVSRFADYIKKYSKDTQFIVITHRKGTMEVASSVYGVTMQEYGISKVISMKLK